MKRTTTMIILGLLLACCLDAAAQMDTLRISTSYTTHVIFSTDLTYADLSNTRTVAAKIVEQNKNMLALKARCEFEESTSISALESNGKMHTFIVVYEQSPEELVVDRREWNQDIQQDGTAMTGESVSRHRKGDAPTLPEMIQRRQKLFHLGESRYGITVLCENVMSYSDITYIVLSLKNRSSVSYSITDATFVIESRKKSRRTVVFEKTIFPKSRYGSLAAAGGTTEKIAYSFDKMTLSEDQVLKVYFYEQDGQRNLTLTLDHHDINRAESKLSD